MSCCTVGAVLMEEYSRHEAEATVIDCRIDDTTLLLISICLGIVVASAALGADMLASS